MRRRVLEALGPLKVGGSAADAPREMEGWPQPERRIASLLVVLTVSTAAGAVGALRGLGSAAYLIAAALTIVIALLVRDALVRLRRIRRLHADHVEDLEVLVGSAALLHSEVDGEHAAGLVARLAISVLHGEAARVLLPDEGEKTFFLAGEDVGGRMPSDLDSMTSEAEPAMIDGRIRRRPLDDRREMLFVPLLGTRRTYGVTVVTRAVQESRAEELSRQTARLFGYLAGRALERLQVIDRLREEAMRDPLTGTGGRRLVPMLLERLEVGDALLLLDLDRFKRVNDEDGHIAGDAVLASLGGYLQERLRGRDSVARYGGDEFLLVLREAGAGAAGAARRLIEGWRSLNPRTTFSVGVALHRARDRPKETLHRVDQALYRAKGAGRDRVVVDEPLEDDECREGSEPTGGREGLSARGDGFGDPLPEDARPDILGQAEVDGADS